MNARDVKISNDLFAECFDTNGPQCGISGRYAYKKGQKFCSTMPCLLQVGIVFSHYVIFTTRNNEHKCNDTVYLRRITTNMRKEFCPNCGNKTLQKLSMTVDDDGSIRYCLSRRKPISARGLKVLDLTCEIV